ncbi:G protein subunit alpha i2 [Homo sapiens]|uniref:G protein subunit alpha i2 n=1 Tax=Homo sapiens TaxID=9606 RepID=F8WBG4_HUMAN|nr:G protein subunit alpha i2 [Homo sapiens]KAI4029795.1 G protein subunit alpha i2 [Homo sapiens]
MTEGVKTLGWTKQKGGCHWGRSEGPWLLRLSVGRRRAATLLDGVCRASSCQLCPGHHIGMHQLHRCWGVREEHHRQADEDHPRGWLLRGGMPAVPGGCLQQHHPVHHGHCQSHGQPADRLCRPLQSGRRQAAICTVLHRRGARRAP